MSAQPVSALRIGVDGEVDDVVVGVEDDSHLRSLYALIGCRTVDVVQATAELDVWVDDEGMFSAPVNVPASFVLSRFGQVFQSYHGTVVVTGGVGPDGDMKPLDPAVRLVVLDLLETLAEMVQP